MKTNHFTHKSFLLIFLFTINKLVFSQISVSFDDTHFCSKPLSKKEYKDEKKRIETKAFVEKHIFSKALTKGSTMTQEIDKIILKMNSSSISALRCDFRMINGITWDNNSPIFQNKNEDFTFSKKDNGWVYCNAVSGTFTKKSSAFDTTTFFLMEETKEIHIKTNVSNAKVQVDGDIISEHNGANFSVTLPCGYPYDISIEAKKYQRKDTTITINKKSNPDIYLRLTEDYRGKANTLKHIKNRIFIAPAAVLFLGGMYYFISAQNNYSKYKKSNSTDEATKLHTKILNQTKTAIWTMSFGVAIRAIAIIPSHKYKEYKRKYF